MSSISYRPTNARSLWTSRPSSSATASKMAAGDAPSATRVATRRSAACSSATNRSSSRAWALAIAVATSSVKLASRSSVPGGESSPVLEPTLMSPHSRPSTEIGAATAARLPTGLARPPGYASMRTARPVFRTKLLRLYSWIGKRTSTGSVSPLAVQLATIVTASSISYRDTNARSAWRSRPTSSATAAKSSVGGVTRATSVATRRSAACSSAARSLSAREASSSPRVCALAIAVATSSVKPASRASVSGGGGSSPVDATPMTPHGRPSTVIGAATAEPMPCSRATAYMSPA